MERAKKEVFTTFEAAEIARVHHETIKNWIRAGMLKAYKTPGGHHRIEYHHLVEFLRKNGIPFAEELRNQAGGRGEKIRVLFVDDEQPLLNAIRRYVAASAELSSRYEIECVSNGFEAGLRVIDFKPDLVVLDIVMPGMDGFKVVETLRAKPATAEIEIVCLTGYPDESNAQKMKSLGVTHLLAKPVEMTKLFLEVEAALVVS